MMDIQLPIYRVRCPLLSNPHFENLNTDNSYSFCRNKLVQYSTLIFVQKNLLFEPNIIYFRPILL